jgi:hypothetical protein
MRDIVTAHIGTFLEGLSQYQTVTSTQHSAAISAATLGKYNGLAAYVLVDATNWGASATMAVTIEVTDDNGSGSPASHWTAIPVTDQIVWEATSATDGTPVRVGNVAAPTISATHKVNQRIGYLGVPQTFVDGSSVTRNADWFRVTSTYGGSGNAVLEVIIALGLPRFAPATV